MSVTEKTREHLLRIAEVLESTPGTIHLTVQGSTVTVATLYDGIIDRIEELDEGIRLDRFHRIRATLLESHFPNESDFEIEDWDDPNNIIVRTDTGKRYYRLDGSRLTLIDAK